MTPAEAAADHAKRRRHVRIAATVHLIIQAAIAVVTASVAGPGVALPILAVGIAGLALIVAVHESIPPPHDDAQA